jgi:hypothetical protein
LDLVVEMLETNHLQRLANAGNALRPDWPTGSLYSHLAKHHAHRAYRDLAVALAFVAADNTTTTPARLLEHGPWWHATAAKRSTADVYRSAKCDVCGGRHSPGGEHNPRDHERPDDARRAEHLAACRAAVQPTRTYQAEEA